MNMSVSSLTKCFKVDMNCTLKGYINANLIQKSKENLLLKDLSIKEIAFQLGFTDEFYFSRFFKKQTGLPPNPTFGSIGLYYVITLNSLKKLGHYNPFIRNYTFF